VPSNVTALPLSSNQIYVAWAASTVGPVGLSNYIIYRNSIAITNTTALGYLDTSLVPSSSYCYAIAADDNFGNISAPSAPVCTLTLGTTTAPTILNQPSNATNVVGSVAVFSATTYGSPVPNCQWQHNGMNLSDGARIIGSGTAYLSILSVQTNDAGFYQIVVSNVAGSVTSTPVMLTVTMPVAPPVLAFSRVATQLTLNWSGTFQLQSCTNLSNPNWVNTGVSTPPFVTSLSQESVFFRLAGGNFNCITPPSGLVAWWPGDGNANDIIGTNNGTLEGGVTFTSGEVGQAFLLNGVNGYIEAPQNTLWAFGTNDFSIELWANFATNQSATLICDTEGGGENPDLLT
jgi:hypothetical protein